MKKLLSNIWYCIKMAPLLIVGGVVWVVEKSIEKTLGRKY